MEKNKFLKELEFLLQDISEEERESALLYYQDYLSEVSSEDEQRVLEELGTPEKVAALIKAGLNDSFDESVEFGDQGVYNQGYQENREVVEATIVDDKDKKKRHFQGNEDRNRLLLIAIAIMAFIIFIVPIGTGVGSMVSVFIGLILAGILIGIFGGFASFIGAIVFIVKGCTIISSATGAGLIFLGIGCLLLSLTYVMAEVTRGTVYLVPKIIKGIVDVVKKLIEKVGD